MPDDTEIVVDGTIYDSGDEIVEDVSGTEAGDDELYTGDPTVDDPYLDDPIADDSGGDDTYVEDIETGSDDDTGLAEDVFFTDEDIIAIDWPGGDFPPDDGDPAGEIIFWILPVLTIDDEPVTDPGDPPVDGVEILPDIAICTRPIDKSGVDGLAIV